MGIAVARLSGGRGHARIGQPGCHGDFRLRRRFHEAEPPVIYANDKFGPWQSRFDERVRLAIA